ncbi:MAG: hypothetical protein JRN20_13200 [Nitrososphaerota archaeon]|nr:hypothetical protein [Nitrososphaerota archaeon]
MESARYYQDIRELVVCSNVQEANGKLKDPCVELLKVDHRTKLLSDGKELSSEPLFILGRRLKEMDGKAVQERDQQNGAGAVVKFEFEHVPKDSPAFLSFKGRILDKLEKDRGMKYKILEDESHNIKTVECYGKLTDDDKKAIERYGSWVQKVSAPPPD